MSPQSPANSDVAALYQVAIDEQIVNVALIVFLNALTINCPEVTGNWTLHRKPMVFKSAENGQKVYGARTDGFLRKRSIREDILAILEVKPILRSSKGDGIRIQEGGQMAAWINNYPPKDLEQRRREGGTWT
jgi:hypothetical protein